MNIGVDFDNTLVDYTDVFRRVALERGWIPSSTPSDKTSVRDYLREQDHEDRWIELQGLVYGPHIFTAKPFSGVRSFLTACRQKKIDLFIISHKTRSPFLGEGFDLHSYALQWLDRNGFFSKENGVPRQNVFLELTQEAKFSRIEELGCSYFVDDLPEFLADPQFPPRVQRILFDPHRQHKADSLYQRVVSWEALGRLFS